MKKLLALWNREPARLVAVIQALGALAMGFGVAIDEKQIASVVAIAALIMGEWTRSKVTPV